MLTDRFPNETASGLKVESADHNMYEADEKFSETTYTIELKFS